MRKILLSLVLCALAFVPVSAAPFAAALVAHALGVSADGGNTATTSAINTTGANLLIAVTVGAGGGGCGGTVTDSKSNSPWIQRTFYGAGGLGACINYVANPSSVGSGHTFTTSASSSFPAIFALAFSGMDTSSPYDTENGNVGGIATTCQTGTVTPANAGSVIIASLFDQLATQDPTIDGGFTISDFTDTVSSQSYAGAAAYLIQGAAAAANPTWTTENIVNSCGIAVFKSAAGGATSFVPGIINAPIRGGGLRAR